MTEILTSDISIFPPVSLIYVLLFSSSYVATLIESNGDGRMHIIYNINCYYFKVINRLFEPIVQKGSVELKR